MFLLFLPIALASTSFTYNGDSECTYPFSDFQITSMRCFGTKGVYVAGYNDYDGSGYNDDSVCSFGDTMTVTGTATLGYTAPKIFNVVMKTCYGGSSVFASTYTPTTCKTTRTTLDLNNYAKLSEAEFYNEEIDESEYFLTPATYKWYAGFTIPSKTFYFSTGALNTSQRGGIQSMMCCTPLTNHPYISDTTGSMVTVHLTLYPVQPYADYPYVNKYASGAAYNAGLHDSKYETTCYASFDAIPDEENAGYTKYYYYRAATGILLLGAATYITMKRKVVCSCDNRRACEDGDESHYTASGHEESSINIETPST
jgi:hypothetical protein